MKFDNTLDFVTKDIQEIEKLVRNFKNYSQIPAIEMDLILSKMRNIYDLLLMLREYETPGQEQFHEEPVTEPTAKNKEILPVSESKTQKKDNPETEHNLTPPKAETKEQPGDLIQKEPSGQGSSPRQEQNPKKEVLGEKLRKDSGFINEKLGAQNKKPDVSSKIQSQPIQSIAGSMGINDKFLYIRELFQGNAENFRQTIEELDRAHNFNEAYNHLLQGYDWDMEDEYVQSLLNLVRRKFITSGNE